MNNPLITFVYSYYDNPEMFYQQLCVWKSYPEKVLNQIEFIITDDCSSKKPMCKSEFPELNIRQFRITKKVPWNWLACRNIGAKYASGKWLLLTDMDHVVQTEHAAQLVKALTKNKKIKTDIVYLFRRIDAPDNTPYKYHDDSFFMSKELYWKIGGYDEELSGNYGTSGGYRRRAFSIANGNHRLKIPLTRYDRSVIADASTTEFARKLAHNEHKHTVSDILKRKKEEGREKEIRVLSFPYEEI